MAVYNDDRLLIKIVKSNEKIHLKKEIPYENAKPMYLVDNIDNSNELKEIVLSTYIGLIN